MATLPSPSQSQTLTRADFDEDTFRRLIAQKGLIAQWSQAAECPCEPKNDDIGLDLSQIVDVADSGAGHLNTCPVCKGTGILYHSTQDVQVILTGAEDEYLHVRFGGYRDGVVNITVNPEHLPSFGDRFVMTQSVMIYRETVDITAANTYTLRFPIAQRSLNLATGAAVLEVLYAHRADSTTGLAIEGGELVQGTDFNVVNKKIEFIAGRKPLPGSRVSFSYFINPSYIVVSYPNSIRDTRVITKRPTDTFVPLPVKVQAKLEFLEAKE